MSGSPALAADEDLPGWTFQEQVDLSDSSRWTLDNGQAANTSSFDLPRNVSFGPSGLTIAGVMERHGGAAYTSGDARGRDIEIPNYSRVEAVGSVPFGQGLWPALIWLRPLDSDHGEIDLMEVFGSSAKATATIHNEYGPHHSILQGAVPWEDLPSSDPTGVHTYVMEKTPHRIMISVDGHVLLDAGPEDVRPGFDWNAIFERPGATWYPRVTFQIGCPPVDLQCGIGVPVSGWKRDSMNLQSLRIWRMATPGEEPPVDPPIIDPPIIDPPIIEPPSVDPPIIDLPIIEPPIIEPPIIDPPIIDPPIVKPPVIEPPSIDTPVVEAPVESGAFALWPGREVRHEYRGGETDGSEAQVAFKVPKNIGSGVMYHALQVASSDDGRSGYRATVTLKASGSIRLKLTSVTGNRRTILDHVTVAKRGAYAPGDVVHVAVSVEDGTVSAKAWVAGADEPDWQLTADGAEPAGNDVLILGYLSKRAPSAVMAPWSDLGVGAP